MLDLVCLGQVAQGNQSLTDRIQGFITANLKHRTTLKELASFLGYSEKYSSEFFQLQMGTSFSHYLKRLRIMKAKHMLAADVASVTHIAEALGFSDCFAFSHFFKRAVGCSPTAFRKQQSALRV
jgi:AraC-like DNA-binding protein